MPNVEIYERDFVELPLVFCEYPVFWNVAGGGVYYRTTEGFYFKLSERGACAVARGLSQAREKTEVIGRIKCEVGGMPIPIAATFRRHEEGLRVWMLFNTAEEAESALGEMKAAWDPGA